MAQRWDQRRTWSQDWRGAGREDRFQEDRGREGYHAYPSQEGRDRERYDEDYPPRKQWDPGNYGDLDRQSRSDIHGRRGVDEMGEGRGYGGYENPGMAGGMPSRDQPQAGPYKGKGPKGYVRSDERIREDLCDRLTDDAQVDASDITVSVAKGEVTLDGTVASRAERRAAEDCAEACSGVSHVQNNLRIKESSGAAGGSIGRSRSRES
jgi:hypothetical protein